MKMKITYDIYDVCFIVIDTLLKRGICPLIWGEMAAIAAYNSNSIATRLFFIVKDNVYAETLNILQDVIKLEPLTTLTFNENNPFFAPYKRFRLSNLVRKSSAYIQIFNNYQVGLDESAWERCKLGSFNGRLLLVPNLSDFLQISSHLTQQIIKDKNHYKPYQITTALFLVSLFFFDCCMGVGFYPTENLKVSTSHAEIAWLLCKRLPLTHSEVVLRWSTVKKDHRFPEKIQIWRWAECPF